MTASGSEILRPGFGKGDVGALDRLREKVPDVKEMSADWTKYLWTWDAVEDAEKKLKEEMSRSGGTV